MNTPFKFLDAYTREDREIFFGRDHEIEEMYQKIFSGKILLIYGISGTGKTSLINCGLANKFEDSDWLPVNIRRGSDIIKSLWTEINKVTLTPLSAKSSGSRKDKPSLAAALQSIYLDHFKPIYLIFDQFEELFIFGDRSEREEFIGLVKEVIDSDVQCKFLFSIREEYLAWVTEFETVISEFLANRMRVEKMTRQHAMQVIEGPCRVHDIAVEEGFPEALLDKLNPEGNEIELTYLQVFLDKIYRLSQQARPDVKSSMPGINNTASGADTEKTGMANQELRFDKLLLDKAGDVSDLLGSFLEDQIRQLDEPDTGLTILKAFVSMQGTKKQVTKSEALEFSKTLGKNIPNDQLKELIQRFVNLRILRDKDENDRYELRHDSLAAKIYEKITLVEKELLEVRQFIENARQTYKKRKILLSDKDLKYLQVYEDRLFLEGELKDFVELSKQAIHAKRKQFNTILRISLAGFVLIIAGIGYYYYRTISESRNIASATKSMLQSNMAPELSYKTALETYRKDSSSSLAHFAVLRSFEQLRNMEHEIDSADNVNYDPYKQVFDFEPCHAKISCAAFTEYGSLIYGWLADNTVKVWSRKGKEVFSAEQAGAPITVLSVSDDNQYMAVIQSDSTGSLCNITNRNLFEFSVITNPVLNKGVVDFSHDNRFLAVSGPENDIIIYEVNGQEFQRLHGHQGRINYVSFSPDSRFIASASDDKTVIIWNYNRNTGLFGEYSRIMGHTERARSCKFSANSKYVLTAADDSLTAIWDLNGKQVWGHKLRSGWDFDYRVNKICEAEFSKDEKLILITSYHMEVNNSTGINRDPDRYNPVFAQTLLDKEDYYLHSREVSMSRFIVQNFNMRPGQEKLISKIDFNSKDRTVAVYTEENNRITVYADNLLPLTTMPGTCPVYSPDGNYLLYISGKQLNLVPITATEIIRLVDQEKIFGELDFNSAQWFTPY